MSVPLLVEVTRCKEGSSHEYHKPLPVALVHCLARIFLAKNCRGRLSVHFPHFFKRVIADAVINSLRDLKWRVLARSFLRHTEFRQSPEDAQASALLSIVVPISDAPTVTRRCLASLEKYASRAEIILVDDGSRLIETRNIIEDFASRNSWKLVHHEKAAGHSVACGAGASLATRAYLCLLNSDTVVTPWCWRLIKEAFENDQTVSETGLPQAVPEIPRLCPLFTASAPIGMIIRYVILRSV